MATRSSNDTPQTLDAFMRAKARHDCKICALPAEVRAQIGKSATDRGYSRDDQVEWLNAAVGAGVSRQDLDRHISRRHEETIK